MPFHAHTSKLPDGKTTNPDTSTWEPLFTPFGEGEDQCQRHSCKKCERMDSYHGHLNKVAYHTAQFAAEMFPENSEESKSAHQWGYLIGLWHDLGKFSVEFQERLKGHPLPVDHSTAGARHCASIPHFGPLLSYMRCN